MEFFHFPFKIFWFDTYKDGKVLETDEFTVEAMKVKHTIKAVAYKFSEKGRLKLDKKKIKELGLSGMEAKELKEEGMVTREGRKTSIKEASYTLPGKTFVYSGDTTLLKKMEKFAEGADVLAHDCTSFTKEDLDEKMHTSFEELVKSKLPKVAKKIYLIHIGRKYQNHEELQKEAAKYKNIFFAKDLEKIVI